MDSMLTKGCQYISNINRMMGSNQICLFYSMANEPSRMISRRQMFQIAHFLGFLLLDISKLTQWLC
uniref:Uncharacterized protein n=1 Tax=Rhizophora mucronata TaxID=61149 RepID=A0A2P2J2V5_RHIMU